MKTIPTDATVYAIAWPLGMNAVMQHAIIFIDTIIVDSCVQRIGLLGIFHTGL